jgi:hypothetical protein
MLQLDIAKSRLERWGEEVNIDGTSMTLNGNDAGLVSEILKQLKELVDTAERKGARFRESREQAGDNNAAQPVEDIEGARTPSRRLVRRL